MLKGMFLHLFCQGCGKNYGNAVAFPADDDGWVIEPDDLAHIIDAKGWGLYINEDEEKPEELLCPDCAEKRNEAAAKVGSDLAVVYVEYMKKLEKGEVKGNTWNDFYDYADVPVENRSDFASAAILNKLVERKEI